ncbi:MAG: malate synthase A, partial [Burkholderiales bacterium]
VWQWIRSPKGKLDDGRKITADMVRAMIPQELEKIRAQHGDQIFNATPYQRGAVMFEKMSTSDDFVEFLTLPAYAAIE